MFSPKRHFIQRRVAESEVKYPTPTPDTNSDFPQFPSLTLDSYSLAYREWNLSVKINGNRGTH